MLTEAPEWKRYCVTYREQNAETKKTKVFHSFFSAIDAGGAEAEFWDTPIWKPPVKKIEIVSIEEV